MTQIYFSLKTHPAWRDLSLGQASRWGDGGQLHTCICLQGPHNLAATGHQLARI